MASPYPYVHSHYDTELHTADESSIWMYITVYIMQQSLTLFRAGAGHQHYQETWTKPSRDAGNVQFTAFYFDSSFNVLFSHSTFSATLPIGGVTAHPSSLHLYMLLRPMHVN